MGIVCSLNKPFADAPTIERIEIRCTICNRERSVERNSSKYTPVERDIDCILVSGWVVDIQKDLVFCPYHADMYREETNKIPLFPEED